MCELGVGSWWDCTRSAGVSVSNRFALLNPGETAGTLFLVMLRAPGAGQELGVLLGPAGSPARLPFSCCPGMWLLEL